MTTKLAASRRPMKDSTTSGAAAPHIVVVVTAHQARGHQLNAALREHARIAINVASCQDAAVVVSRLEPSLTLVDLDLTDARSLIAHLVEEHRGVIATCGAPEDRAWALRIGCLDVIHSLDPDEVALKIGALGATHVDARGPLSVGALHIDPRSASMSWRGRPIVAPHVVVQLAICLAVHSGELVSTQTLLNEVWGEPWADSSRVRQAIWRLKRCLGAGASILVVRRGFGYGFIPQIRSLDRTAG